MSLSFSSALAELKDGKRAARAGWNGKGSWVCYMPPVQIPDDAVNARTRRFIPSGHLNVGGYFVMYTAQGIWQPGWLASQADMLADDWTILEDAK